MHQDIADLVAVADDLRFRAATAPRRDASALGHAHEAAEERVGLVCWTVQRAAYP
jgi:hypothetical protein